MIQPHEQGAEFCLQALAPVMAILYPAIEAADQEARDYFGDGSIDAALYPNIVRYHVKLALAARGLSAVEDDSPVLQHHVLANNGLFLRYGPRRLRIRKSDRQSLPPAASKAMKDFFQQDSLFQEAIEAQNLVVLWDISTGVVELRLVCPKTGDGAIYWSQPVPHPAQVQEASLDDNETVDDLPITLAEDEDVATANDE